VKLPTCAEVTSSGRDRRIHTSWSTAKNDEQRCEKGSDEPSAGNGPR